MTRTPSRTRATEPEIQFPLSMEEFAALGQGEVAYLKPIRSEDVPLLVPDAPAIPPGLALFALLSADGTPIMIGDSRSEVAENALEHDLAMVSLH